jgi:predicted small metal-binding protein
MKELRCRDVGFDCEGVVSGPTEDDVLRHVAAHAQEVHGLTAEQVDDPDFVRQVEPHIRDRAR